MSIDERQRIALRGGLLARRHAVVLDDEGLTIEHRFGASLRLPWGDITGASRHDQRTLEVHTVSGTELLVGHPRQIDAVAARIVAAVEERDDGRGYAAVDPADVLRWLDGFEEAEHQQVVSRRLSGEARGSLGCGGLLLLSAAAVALGCGIADWDDGFGVGMLLMIPGVLLMLPGLLAVGDLSQRRQRVRRFTVRANADRCEVARDGRPFRFRWQEVTGVRSDDGSDEDRILLGSDWWGVDLPRRPEFAPVLRVATAIAARRTGRIGADLEVTSRALSPARLAEDGDPSSRGLSPATDEEVEA